MQLYQVDDLGHLFISPAIQDWSVLERHRIDTVIDLEGGLDLGVPTVPNQCLYIYFPQGAGVSKLSNSFIERRLKVRGTARNWNTVGKLAALLA